MRNAVARFDQVIDVPDADRALAFANVKKAAKYHDLDLSDTNCHQLGVHPQRHRKEAAAKAVETKRERGEALTASRGTEIVGAAGVVRVVFGRLRFDLDTTDGVDHFRAGCSHMFVTVAAVRNVTAGIIRAPVV